MIAASAAQRVSFKQARVRQCFPRDRAPGMLIHTADGQIVLFGELRREGS